MGCSAARLANAGPNAGYAKISFARWGRSNMICENHKVCVCGVEIDQVTMGQVVASAERAIRDRTKMHISVVNVAKTVNMRADLLLRESVVRGDVVLADGMPLKWVSQLRGHAIPERVAGVDLMYELFGLANQQHLRVYLLGARDDVLHRVVRFLMERYPNMALAGFRNGYFPDCEAKNVALAIRRARADISVVGMPSPRKELFLRRWSNFMGVPVCHGVGGSLDIVAGIIKRAPPWMRCAGLEWLYRLLQEPSRMWKRYARTNLIFLGLVGFCLLCRRVGAEGQACPWRTRAFRSLRCSARAEDELNHVQTSRV